MKITRSFSKKVMLSQFEPIDSFCAVEEETIDENKEKISLELDEFCRKEVEKTIAQYVDRSNICEVCGGIIRYSSEDKKVVKGLCQQCKKTILYSTK